MKIKIKKNNPNAMYRVATAGSAGIDIAATGFTIGISSITYHLGLSVEIPDGFFGMMVPRSSIVKRGLRMSNSVGIIDSDYRGEVKAVFDVIDFSDIYQTGEYVCQLIILPVIKFDLIEADELNETDRGTGGFGSTGA